MERELLGFHYVETESQIHQRPPERPGASICNENQWICIILKPRAAFIGEPHSVHEHASARVSNGSHDFEQKVGFITEPQRVHDHQNVENYKRSLDLRTGINTIEYSVNGKRFKRESFISVTYDAIIYRFESLDAEGTNCSISFDRFKDIEQSIQGNRIVVKGQIFDDLLRKLRRGRTYEQSVSKTRDHTHVQLPSVSKPVDHVHLHSGLVRVHYPDADAGQGEGLGGRDTNFTTTILQ